MSSIAFVLALPLITAVAQQKPDFSGTWKLNVAKSEFGALPGPKSRVDVITHKDPSLSVNVTQEGADGRLQYAANYTTDGKTRTVSIHYASAMGETDQKLIFEKQESGAAAPAKTP